MTPLKLARAFGIMSAVVILHELGHTIAALFFGIPVQRFSIGFGPGFTIPGIPYIGELHFGLIFVGGYVQLADFAGAGYAANLLISLAGIMANLLTAFILLQLTGDPDGSPSRMLLHWIFGVGIPKEGIINENKQIVGPIGLFKILALSPRTNAQLIAWLSLALANMNLWPIFFLDGGRATEATLRLFMSAKNVEWGMIAAPVLFLWIMMALVRYMKSRNTPEDKSGKDSIT